MIISVKCERIGQIEWQLPSELENAINDFSEFVKEGTDFSKEQIEIAETEYTEKIQSHLKQFLLLIISAYAIRGSVMIELNDILTKKMREAALESMSLVLNLER